MRRVIHWFFLGFGLLVINFFFYSFITIGLYKLICYESNSIDFFINIYSLDKATSSFFYSHSFVNLWFVNSFWYCAYLSNNYIFSDINIFYVVLKDVYLSYFFLKLNSSLQSSEIEEMNLIFLNFYIRSSNLSWIHSISLQKTIILNINETSLFFFRIYNPSHLNIKLITLYMVYPNTLTLYINKIQCFCFNVLFLYSLEIVDLPVLLYIHPFINFLYICYLDNVIIYYIVFLN